MNKRRRRLGIRAQFTLIVLLGAVLSTAATLFVAYTAIQNYALHQANAQEKENMNIALLVLRTQYGRNISISSGGKLVADAPTAGSNIAAVGASGDYGKYQLDGDSDYVSEVQTLIGGYVSVYKCADASGALLSYGCQRIATTLPAASAPAAASGSSNAPANPCAAVDSCLSTTILDRLRLGSSPQPWLGVDSISGQQFYADYAPLFNPQQQPIGVLFVGVPLSTVTTFQQQTSIALVLLGIIIMIAGAILALLLASAIISTLQNAARQVSGASEHIGGIAAQQTGGSAQQVWAVNAINKALQNFAEMARDISQRTEQLALMGNQVIQRRAEIAPAQIDSILAYMTRSVRDISMASRQQASQYERMTGAMQAVIEIAEQVAANSEQATESAEQLDVVVGQLQELVGVRRLGAHGAGAEAAEAGATATDGGWPSARSYQAPGQPHGQPQPTIRAIRPPRGASMGAPSFGAAAPNSQGLRGPMPPGPPVGTPAAGWANPAYGAPPPAVREPARPPVRGARPAPPQAPAGGWVPAPAQPPAMGGYNPADSGFQRRMPPLPPMPDDPAVPPPVRPAPYGGFRAGYNGNAPSRAPASDGSGRGWGENGTGPFGGGPDDPSRQW